jgi:hypothetical protein
MKTLTLSTSAIVCLCTLLGVAGCATTAATPETTNSTPPQNQTAEVQREDPRDAQAPAELIVQMEVFDLTVPVGSISRNSEFWKRIDEEFLGFERQVMLDKNGMRIGRASADELSQLSTHMDAAQPKRSTIKGMRGDDMEFEMREVRNGQTLFVFDQSGEPTGRDFGPSDNLIYLSFRQSTRNPENIRVAIAPAVRAQRSRLEYTGSGSELQVRDRTAEMRYNNLDLNFEIPPDHFVILAPSSKGTMQTSLGQAFFTQDTPAERLERVLILRPRPKLAMGK